MAYAQSTDAYGGGANLAIAAGKSTDTVLSATPARLCRIIVTAAGSANTQIFDNASAGSGTVIGIIPTAAAVGTVIDFSIPAMLGITVKGLATNHGFTVSFN
jgi:hypothetical protein